ncbi:hypothetical protein [Sinorhizobium meliloti]|uniref:hypothetical protein n=2 Tax=Rhizobium meliloti TaxID=382 RepID=UPI000518A95A|nr:hypothetical protein [Sinorhizobium meliloti]
MPLALVTTEPDPQKLDAHMTGYGENFNLMKMKLIGFGSIIIGFLVAASGYRYGSLGIGLAGVGLLIIGIAFIVGHVLRRNERR